MTSIWNSKMENSLKIRNVKATIEPILLYGSECWTNDSTMPKKIDGYYTRLLRMAAHIPWKDNFTNTQLYTGIPNIFEMINKEYCD